MKRDTFPQKPHSANSGSPFEWNGCLPPAAEKSEFAELLLRVQQQITPVWPLEDYVAVNPVAGSSSSHFLESLSELRSVSNIDLLMPLEYYRQKYREGKLTKQSLNTALDELVVDQVAGIERLDISQLLSALNAESIPEADVPLGACRFESLVDCLDRCCRTQWREAIDTEISKYCASYFDRGQAVWRAAEENTLFSSWKTSAQIDWNFELLGVGGFRKLVSKLPADPMLALRALLTHLEIPRELWYPCLLSEAWAQPGWSAYARYQDQQAEQQGESGVDFISLLAIRLAYQLAVSRHSNFWVRWQTLSQSRCETDLKSLNLVDQDRLRLVLLKASEIEFRSRLLAGVCEANSQRQTNLQRPANLRHLAQMVFCIDVRSERMRRHLEASSPMIETYGFAGFFGLPIEFIPLGATQGHACVPVLLTPQFKVREELEDACEQTNLRIGDNRRAKRWLRRCWNEFQSSAASCFSFVESMGWWYGVKLIGRSLGWKTESSPRFDGVDPQHQPLLGPVLRGLPQQGINASRQIDLAESILRGIGILDGFGRLVVFCGHGCQVENNPLQAGMDCGACGGHTGEANARLAAKLLNQKFVRQGLAERGIVIPDDTHFLGALHNTTTDDLEFFDLQNLPTLHRDDLEQLKGLTLQASRHTQRERLVTLSGRESKNTNDLLRRSRDWSEVRPEWGLVGNAGFIASPEALPVAPEIRGRIFQHSYRFELDTDFKILEQILAAPMMVAHWINMQYYASTVAPTYFSSGNKTIHNVVGKFGVLSGNTGDLMTGLPWQSIHNGEQYQHDPLRLQAVIFAPRQAISTIVSRQKMVREALHNGWMQLMAVEAGVVYRYSETGEWEVLIAEEPVGANS